jgi:hypothetical protein
VCSGGTFNFGGSTLTTTGNYTHIYTTAQGCDSTVQLDFAVLDSIRIASSSGVNGFCPTFGVRLGMNAPITNAQYQWYRNGNLLSGEVSDTLLASQVGDYRLDVVISPTCTLSSNSLSVSELNCNRVRGDLRYDNNPQTPLAGVPVHLKTLLGNILMSDTTDSLGMYEMVGYPNGNYLLDAGVNYQWGGVNSSDALLVSRYFTSLLTLTPLRIRAGDVNGNGTTNSVDALNITRRSANIITAFAAGDFVNSRPSVVAVGNPIDMNLRVLSTGDVNGSYGVPVSTPVLVLDTVYSTFPTGTATVRFTTSGSGIFERGVCWGTSPSPTISQNKSIAGTGGFDFTLSFGGLTGGTLYYVRAYARNSSGTVYSNERSFYNPSSPLVTTTPISGITASGALSGGNVVSDGGLAVTARGVVYDTISNPTLSSGITSDSSGLGSYVSTITGLTPLTTYYLRAYATNSLGTSYGNEISFSTSTVNIGDTYGGGVVFYIDATGRHGVVCATYDQGNFQWLPAIIFCSNLNLNGYDDWFLPSIGELGLMYNLRGQLGNFSGTYYWSSTQNGPNNAWYVHFAHGFTSSNASTSNTFQVRAVRAF